MIFYKNNIGEAIQRKVKKKKKNTKIKRVHYYETTQARLDLKTPSLSNMSKVRRTLRAWFINAWAPKSCTHPCLQIKVYKEYAKETDRETKRGVTRGASKEEDSRLGKDLVGQHESLHECNWVEKRIDSDQSRMTDEHKKRAIVDDLKRSES